MSAPSAVKSEREARNQKRSELRKRIAQQGMAKPATQTIPNRKSEWETVEEQQEARQKTVEEQMKVYHRILPGLLKKIAKAIKDKRQQNKVTYKVDVLMLYGILMYVLQTTSRRNANGKLSQPELEKSLMETFPELKDTPHEVTLCRLLEE